MPATDTKTRQAVLSVSLAVVMVTAGCGGMLSGEGSTNTGTPTLTDTLEQQDHSTSSANGGTSSADDADLRTMSIPDNGSVTVSGKLDRGDPKSGKKYYEPIQVAAAEGEVVNITMRAEGDARPAIRVVNPDGNVTQNISNKEGNATGFIRGNFTQTGRYTFEATSVNQNATFNYTFTIERSELPERDLFEGDMSEWNQTEQHLEFIQDFGGVINDTVPELGSFPETDSDVREGKITANASGDYAVYTYEIDPDLNFSQQNQADVVFMITYANADETYRNGLANDPEYVEDGTWVPEIIFFRGINEETGELYRTTFLTRDWAQEYIRADNKDEAINPYSADYYSTLRYGPAVQADDPEDSVTEAEFPQIYWNYTYPNSNTTLAERYGL